MQNNVIAVFGHRGSGKTTWIFRHLEEFKPFVLVDPLFDPKFRTLNLHQITQVEDAIQLFKNGNPQRIYISPNLVTFDYFCGLCLARGNMTLIVDEVDHYATNYYLSHYFKVLIKYGRHRQVDLIAACRRPMEMNKLIRTQANRFIVFPLGGEDAKELENYLGNVRGDIASLAIHSNHTEYIDYNFNTKEMKRYTLNLCNIDVTEDIEPDIHTLDLD